MRSCAGGRCDPPDTVNAEENAQPLVKRRVFGAGVRALLRAEAGYSVRVGKRARSSGTNRGVAVAEESWRIGGLRRGWRGQHLWTPSSNHANLIMNERGIKFKSHILMFFVLCLRHCGHYKRIHVNLQ